jgi:hypothetical protein
MGVGFDFFGIVMLLAVVRGLDPNPPTADLHLTLPSPSPYCRTQAPAVVERAASLIRGIAEGNDLEAQ